MFQLLEQADRLILVSGLILSIMTVMILTRILIVMPEKGKQGSGKTAEIFVWIFIAAGLALSSALITVITTGSGRQSQARKPEQVSCTPEVEPALQAKLISRKPEPVFPARMREEMNP